MSNGWQSGRTADEIRSGEVDASIDAVLTDEDAIANIMLAAERAGIADESPLVETLSREQRSRTIREARQSGDSASMSMATGLSDTRVEATGYDMLVSALKPAAQQVLVKGPKGSGKTTKALDLARHLHAEMGGDLSVLTNIRGPDEHPDVDYADTLSGMLEWVRDTSGEKLVIGDEWSSTVNAHAGSNVSASFARFINALRKGEGGSTRLIVIGHEHSTDIAKIVRTQSDIVLEADGKIDDGLIDCATVYEGWSEYQQDDSWVKLRGLRDVPADSEWGADTNYFATFDLDLDDPEKQIQKGKLVENWREYQEGDDVDEEGEEPATVCGAETNSGSTCPNDAQWPPEDPQVCKSHRHTITDDDTDDDEDTNEN